MARAASRAARVPAGPAIGRGASRSAIEPVAAAVLPRGAEIDCVRHFLSPAIARWAERRAEALNIGADRALIAAGHIQEETYVLALAAALGISFESLETVERAACPLSDARLLETAAIGILPLRSTGRLVWVIAPRDRAAQHITALLRGHPQLAERIRLTTSDRLRRFVIRHAGGAIAHRAVSALNASQPLLSAASHYVSPWLATLTAGIGVAAVAAPRATMLAVGFALALVFLAWIALRLASAVVAPRLKAAAPPHFGEDELPVYTIIIPLYRETAALAGLLRALRELDYPPEKLDIKIVLEWNDHATRAAINRMQLGPPFETVIAPAAGPRTKPRALNAALLMARGTFTAIYDAEDRPEPGQLRRALAAFRDGPETLACVQARLTIDNTDDGWLARLFTAEFAGLFDVFLPAIAARRLPMPLGGSSNHFRTATLRQVGGWDPYNVTEDADLGIRLARFGFDTAVIDSTTYEEAPIQLAPWLRQRTRWFKGWLQTWLVHMREPLRLARELGPAGFAAIQLVLGGTVLAALVHPIFVVLFAHELVTGNLFAPGEGVAGLVFAWLALATFLGGYFVSALLGYIGLARRNLHAAARSLLLMPVHWALLSLAAWRALVQLVRDPYRWEKTEHGLAKTSRLARAAGERREREVTRLRLARDDGRAAGEPAPLGHRS